MNNKVSNYNIPFDYARNKLKELDPIKISKLGNLEYDGKRKIFKIDFMGDLYEVSYPDGEVYNNGMLCNNLSLKIILVRYLINATGVKPTDKFITYKEVPGGNVFYPNYLKTVINKLSIEFEDCIDEYKKVMDKMGAIKIDVGDLGYKFKYIGNTYIIFILWFKDDEFRQSSNILFDSNLIYYFNAEDLAVCPSIAIDIIKNKVNNIKITLN